MSVELKSLDDAMALLDEWIAAYEDLAREHLRLLWEQAKLRDAYGHAAAVIENDRWYEAQAARSLTSCPF